MKEQNIARAYARSVIELGDEFKVDVAEELTKLQILINESNELENLLFLDIFSIVEKKDVLGKIFEKIEFASMLEKFIFFLIEEKRISLFPSIYKEIMVMDDHKKGFLSGTIEGHDADIGAEERKLIEKMLKDKIGRTPKLQYVQKTDLTAGYRVTAEDLQLDASLNYQFDKLKQSILGD